MLHEEEGAGSGPFTVSLWYIVTRPWDIACGPGSAFPEWQLLPWPGGNSPWDALLLSLDTLDLQVLFLSHRQKHDSYPTNQPSKRKKKKSRLITPEGELIREEHLLVQYIFSSAALN